MNAPCKDCPDRDYPHCHMVCEKYRAFREYRDRINAERRAMNGAEWENDTKARATRKKLNRYKRDH